MDGAVLVDKPVGPTSHDVVRQVRRATGADAAGHTGTLDPFATGLLVVLLGKATRLARFVEGDRKAYLATAHLGHATETDDVTGSPIGTPVATDGITEAEIRRGLAVLTGEIRQVPPAYSAKKVDGRRAYDAARAGAALALPPVAVTVHALELVRWAPPVLEFRCVVSAGTYVRAIARDLGAALGCGAHLTALRREAIGGLQVSDAVALSAVDAATPILPPAAVVAHLPRVTVPEARLAGLRHGQALPPQDGLAGIVALRDGAGTLLAMGEADERRIRPVVVLAGAG